MEIEKLIQIGLNRNEARIYLSLLELKEALAGELSKKSQINRTTTYDALERLIDRGLVTYVISANKKVFKPVSPEKLLSNIKEKERVTKEILPSLNKLFLESKKEEESNVYKGRKGINTILNDILNYKEYVAFGSSGKFLEIMKHDFVIFQKKKEKFRIKSRIIQSESVRKDKELRRVAYATFRYIPDEFSVPSTSIVYGDKLAIIVWGEVPIATVVKSKQVAESYKKYFEFVWKVSRK